MQARILSAAPQRLLSWIPAAAFLGLVFFCVAYFADYGNWFIHPHQFEIHLSGLLGPNSGHRLRSFANILQQFDPTENRPRFLAYAIIWANLNLRMALYDLLVLYPPFSVGWLLELLVAPFLLFRLVRNMTSSQAAAPWIALIVYVTSIGFLSGFAMPLMPSKPLSNVVFIAVLWLLSEARRSAEPGQLLHETPGGRRTSWILALVLLSGLFLDEVPLFAFLLPLLFYRELFLPRGLHWREMRSAARSWLPLLAPVLVFAVIVIAVVPPLTQKLFGYRFDMLGSVFVNKEAAESGKTFFSGKTYGFGMDSLAANAGSLFGSALLPSPVAKYSAHPSGGGVITGMEPSAALTIAVLALLCAVLALSLRANSVTGSYLRRAVASSLLFVLFMSLLSGRHVPFISGYVYGGAFAVFLALIVGLAAGAARSGITTGIVLSAALAMSVIQLINFDVVNKNWIAVHNEQLVRPAYEKSLRIAVDGRATTRAELEVMRKAWQRGVLEAYLTENVISSGAVFLVFELRHLEKWRATGRSR